jgi:hypothetical protein
MSHRQLADQAGHRWDVEDQGPLRDEEGPESDNSTHQLRFTRDDGSELVREAPFSLDQMADRELRMLLRDEALDRGSSGPDLEANRSDGYGDARD